MPLVVSPVLLALCGCFQRLVSLGTPGFHGGARRRFCGVPGERYHDYEDPAFGGGGGGGGGWGKPPVDDDLTATGAFVESTPETTDL